MDFKVETPKETVKLDTPTDQRKWYKHSLPLRWVVFLKFDLSTKTTKINIKKFSFEKKVMTDENLWKFTKIYQQKISYGSKFINERQPPHVLVKWTDTNALQRKADRLEEKKIFNEGGQETGCNNRHYQTLGSSRKSRTTTIFTDKSRDS